MDGEWSSHIILEEKGVGAVEEVVVVLEALIWSAMSVVSLVILLVNAECEEVQVLVNVEVVALLDIGGAQVMVAGVIVLVDVPPNAEACHLVAVVIADLHTVEEMKFLIPMEMVSGTESEAGAERRSWLLVSFRSFSMCVLLCLTWSQLCKWGHALNFNGFNFRMIL